MGNFQETVVKFILAALLIISLFSFIVYTQINNDAPNKIIDNPIFNASYVSLNGNIANSSDAAQSKYGSFNSEQPQTGIGGSIILFGIVSVGKSFSEITFGFFKAVIYLPLVILGVPETIYNLLIMILIIVIIVGVWLLYKLGG